MNNITIFEIQQQLLDHDGPDATTDGGELRRPGKKRNGARKRGFHQPSTIKDNLKIGYRQSTFIPTLTIVRILKKPAKNLYKILIGNLECRIHVAQFVKHFNIH